MSESFGYIAGTFSALGYLLYILAILKGTTKPSRTTWWIWTPIAVTLYLSADASGAKETLWVALSEVIGITLIAVLSIKFGESSREEGEAYCIIGSAISLVILVWMPGAALVVSLITDSFALWPTIKKSMVNPEHEDLAAWSVTQTGNFFNLLAISSVQFGDVVYPVWLFVLDGILLYVLIFRKRRIT